VRWARLSRLKSRTIDISGRIADVPCSGAPREISCTLIPRGRGSLLQAFILELAQIPHAFGSAGQRHNIGERRVAGDSHRLTDE